MITNSQRFYCGVAILIFVDFIWVASSEVTEYLFRRGGHFNKPFFSCYLKFSLFTFLLPCYSLWQLARYFLSPQPFVLSPREVRRRRSRENLIAGSNDESEPELVCHELSEPSYVKTLPSEAESQSGVSEEDFDMSLQQNQQSVRFARVSEVRQLPADLAEDATFARLSYEASVQSDLHALRAQYTVRTSRTIWLALLFSIVFFAGNYFYQLALQKTEVSIVNTVSTTAAFFALIFSSISPTRQADHVSVTKVLAVLLNLGGVGLVAMSTNHKTAAESSPAMTGIWLGLAGALCYAVYAVLLARSAPDERALNLPVFFGFVGLFSTLLIWPGFFILHYTGIETFVLPTRWQWFVILANGVVGTVLSELLWGYACLMTSSVMATLLPSLVIPMSILADHVLWKEDLPTMFHVGLVPILLSLVLMTWIRGGSSDPLCGSICRSDERNCGYMMPMSPADGFEHPEEERLLANGEIN